MLERTELSVPSRQPALDRTQLRVMTQAALKAEAVTGDPAWDLLMSYLQRALDVAVAARNEALQSLASPSLVGADKISQTRHAVFMFDERIRTLQLVISMPAELKKTGSIAKEKLDQMEIEDGEREEAKT